MSTIGLPMHGAWRPLILVIALLALPVMKVGAVLVEQPEDANTKLLNLGLRNSVAQNTEFAAVVKAVNAGNLAEAKQLLSALREEDPLEPTVWEIEGTISLIEGQLEEAERALRKSLELAPRVPAVMAKLGAALYGQSQYEAAREVLLEAYQLDPKSIFTLQFLARLAVRDGDGEAAGEYYGKAVQLSADTFSPVHREYAAYLIRASRPVQAEEMLASFSGIDEPEGLDLLRLRAALAAGDAKKARAFFDSWSKQAGSEQLDGVQFYSALVDRLAGEAGRAEQTLSRLRALNPDSALVAYELAVTLFAQGKSKEGLAMSQRAAKTAQPSAELTMDIASLVLRNGQPGIALKMLDSVAPESQDASFLVLLAQATANSGDLPAAVEVTARLNSQYPEYAPGYQLRAQLLESLGESSQARDVAAVATTQFPQSVNAWTSRAGLLLRQQKPKEALAVIEEAQGQIAGNSALLFQAANAKQLLGRTQQAEQDYRVLMKDPTTRLPSLNNLANLLAQDPKRYSEAESVARRAHALAPDSPAIEDTLGWILYLSGSKQLALTHLRSAYQLAENDPDTVCHLGVVSADEEPAAATALLERCLELSPAPALAELARAKLGR